MRIGLVIENFDPRRGGVEQWTYQFAGRVIAAGHEVHAVARRFVPEIEQLGVVTHRVECSGSKLGFAWAAEQRLRTLPLDVIHDTGCGWYCDVLQPHGGARSASFEQNLLMSPSWLRPIKRRAAAWLPRYKEMRQLAAKQYSDPSRLYLAISGMVARDLQLYHGVDEKQLRLVYNGVDIERFTPRQRDPHRQMLRKLLGVWDEEVLLLIVAHNFRLKGVSTLLRAVGRLSAEGQPVRLVVAGGKDPQPYVRMAQRVGAGAAVTFVGSLADPVPYYAAADVYVQPTFYDPCSLVVLEALASGLPVVTSRYNGAGELLTEGTEGYLVQDPSDAAELTDRLRPLFDAAVRQRMGKAARELALKHSLHHNCQEILAVYRESSDRLRMAA
jgi:UDP-glucose:(heptosyl)LPS alpha-1,3-glucosyltransferase